MPTSQRGKTRESTSDSKRTVEERLDEMQDILSTLITQQSMDRKLSKLKEDIRNENRELVEKLEGRIEELMEENDSLRQAVGHLEEKILEIQDFQKKAELKQNDLEQYGRKNSIRIVGLQGDESTETTEQCVNKVVSFVNDKLKVQITKCDIDIAHRLGKFSSSRPRNVIVKLTRRVKKHEIISARRHLKGTRQIVFEDLTRPNQEILKTAFKLNCVKHTYSIEGKLFALLQNGRKRQLYLDTPLEERYLMNDANF